jgi:hypothetical protein
MALSVSTDTPPPPLPPKAKPTGNVFNENGPNKDERSILNFPFFPDDFGKTTPSTVIPKPEDDFFRPSVPSNIAPTTQKTTATTTADSSSNKGIRGQKTKYPPPEDDFVVPTASAKKEPEHKGMIFIPFLLSLELMN